MPTHFLKVGQTSPDNRIYSCTKCGNQKAFLKGEFIVPCEVCEQKNKLQEWKPTTHEFILKARDISKEIEAKKDWLDKIADTLTEFFGTAEFLFFHLIWFGLWLLINTGKTPIPIFDPYPYGLLTMVVSLEAIFLALFILISQNRATQVNEMRSELDYQVNVKAEKRTAEILALLKERLPK